MAWAQTEKSDVSVLYVGGSSDLETVVTKVDSAVLAEDVKARMASFEQMLKEYFKNVAVVDAKDYVANLSDNYDVTIFDGVPPVLEPRKVERGEDGRILSQTPARYLPDNFSRPAVMIAEMGETLGRRIGLKTDWYCLCLRADAHSFRAEHPIFHGPFPVTMTTRMEPTPEDALHYAYFSDDPLPDSVLMWKVQTYGDKPETPARRIGMVSRPWGFEDSPEAEYISSGVCAKTIDAVAIGRHGNFLHWGFSASPRYMTDEAKSVFANAIVYISDPNVKLGEGERHTIANVKVTTSEGAVSVAETDYTFVSYEDVKTILVTSADGQTSRKWKLQFTELIQIPNSDFESWGKFGNDVNNNVQTINPIPGKGKGWATANNTFVQGALPIDYQGGKAAQLTTKIQNAIVFGELIASGSLFTGSFKINVTALDDSRSMTYFGVPYTLRPAAMEFDLRYEAGDTLCQAVKSGTSYSIVPIEGVDSGHAWVELLRWEGKGEFEYHGRETDGVVVIGRGELVVDGKDHSYRNWGHYKLPIEYYDETSLPTHIAIVFSSSWKGDEYIGAPGSVMEVDNVQLIY